MVDWVDEAILDSHCKRCNKFTKHHISLTYLEERPLIGPSLSTINTGSNITSLSPNKVTEMCVECGMREEHING